MRSATSLFVALLFFALAPASFAQVITNWIGTGTGDWNLSGNWDNGIPGSADTARISNGGIATISTSANVGSLDLGFGNNFSGTVIVQNGGSLAIATATIGINSFGITFGAGTLQLLNGGTINMTGIVTLGKGTSSGSGHGTLLMSGGTLNSAMSLFVGGNNVDPSTATTVGYAEQDDGVANFGTAGVDSELRIGAQSSGGDTASGTYLMAGGTINFLQTNNASMFVAEGGRGTFLMTGGVLNGGTRGVDVGRNRGIGYVDLSGGTSTFPSMVVGGNAFVVANNGGTGTFVIRDTANVTMSGLEIASANNTQANTNLGTAIGTFLMQGGRLAMSAGSILLGNGTAGVNTGGFVKSATAYMEMSGGILTTPRVQLTAGNDSTATFNLSGGVANIGTIAIGAGTTNVVTSFGFTGGTLNLQGSAIDITNNGGTLSPGGHGAVGSTTFLNKNYVQLAGSTLAIDISSGTFDTVTNGTGTASIAGTIDVATTDTLSVNQTFDVLVASLVTLDPGTVVTGTDGSGHPFSAGVVNSGTTLELTVNDVPEPTVLAGGILSGVWLLKRRARRGELKVPRRLRCA